MRIRNITETDSYTLRELASRCGWLDVHTEYTYWVLCKYFCNTSFIVEDADGKAIGFVTAVVVNKTIFIWQIGVVEEYRQHGVATLMLNELYQYIVCNNIDRVEVTIGIDNTVSYRTFNSFLKKRGIKLEAVGELRINDSVETKYIAEIGGDMLWI